MAHAAPLSPRQSRVFALIAVLRGLLQRERPGHWTDYLRDSHRR
ncbi:hypothetical protein [Shimia sp.]